MSESSRDYYQRRAEQERCAADEAIDARAAQAHRVLAGHYRTLANRSAVAWSNEAGDGKVATLPKEFTIVR